MSSETKGRWSSNHTSPPVFGVCQRTVHIIPGAEDVIAITEKFWLTMTGYTVSDAQNRQLSYRQKQNCIYNFNTAQDVTLTRDM